MDDYKKMLEDVRKGLPESVFEKERFSIPKVMGHIQGSRTVISNFMQIATTLQRDANHMLKFILRELATPGELKKNGSIIMGTKVPASRINEKVQQYAVEFVFCTECGKPDTKIEKDGQLHYLKCTACGSRNVIKSRI
jgi:translation initiation factor 2 subunit 2